MSKENANSKKEEILKAKQAQTPKTAPKEAKAETEKAKEPETVKETAAQKKVRLAAEKAAKAEAKKKEREDKAAKKKAEKELAKANKPPGVIASILEAVKATEGTKTPTTIEEVHSFLVARFPDRTPDSMMKTVKAQLGGKVQPTRMEKERKVVFEIGNVTEEVEEEVTVGEGDAARKEMVKKTIQTKVKTYLYKGEVMPDLN